MPTSECEWVVLELDPRSDGEDPALVKQSIQRFLKGAEIFIPAVVTQVGDDRVIHYLVDGYAFVRKDTFPDSAFLKLEATRFVQSVLTTPGTKGRRRLATVSSSEVMKMKAQVMAEVHQGIGIGDTVKITTGPYRNISGIVIEELPEQASVQVFIQLRSKQSIITIPRSGLHVVERAPLSSAMSQLQDIKSWIYRAKPILSWANIGHDLAVTTLVEYRRLAEWLGSTTRLSAFVSFAQEDERDRLAAILGDMRSLKTMSDWLDRYNQAARFIKWRRNSAAFSAMTRLYQDFLTLDNAFRRLKEMALEIDDLTREVLGNSSVIQNVIIDGHNLAFRCYHAPGMDMLSDSSGRKTGLVVGFLRGVGAIRKRFPQARIFVAWDGSSARRKQRFSDYKANRKRTNRSEEFDQIGFLRKLLPYMGVRQAFNPDEEADDVIASLVRGELCDQSNVIVSTDKDFTQLVCDNTHLLVPRTGARREVLFDESVVLSTFGVPPSIFLQLRSFYGDSSDNIPGVPRVPKKVLRLLVQTHGSVDGVYKSGLTGLTKGQYERLRAAEPQVRINLELMTMATVPYILVESDVDQGEAQSLLRQLEIDPDSLAETFFPSQMEGASDEYWLCDSG